VLSLSLIMILTTNTIFVVRAQTEHQQQQQYSFVTQWGTEGSGPGEFTGQNDVVPSTDGKYVFVPDYENHRIQKFTSDGTFITQLGSEG
jgi:DNA-binding beta-propeller fold protein YncE